jgi:hypothetical protein
MGFFMALMAGAILNGRAGAQVGSGLGDGLSPESVFDRPAITFPSSGQASGNNAPPSRVPRLRLFRMPSGFLYEPPGLEADDAPPIGPSDPPWASASSSTEPSFVQVAMGLDNPFFDYRWPTDPGGVGFYKLHSQVQLLDQGKTALCLGLSAVTPAGLEAGGLADGPTVICPALAWFQELGPGAALQGFVGKNIRARAGWTDDLENGIHYGMAVQYALPGLAFCPKQSVHVFLEALGRYRYEGENAPGKPLTWELIPGIHMRMGEKWWLSVGAAKTNILTCGWQF